MPFLTPTRQLYSQQCTAFHFCRDLEVKLVHQVLMGKTESLVRRDPLDSPALLGLREREDLEETLDHVAYLETLGLKDLQGSQEVMVTQG